MVRLTCFCTKNSSLTANPNVFSEVLEQEIQQKMAYNELIVSQKTQVQQKAWPFLTKKVN